MSNRPTQSNPLDERAAAPYIGYTPPALRRWRMEGRGPAYIRHKSSVRYLQSDLDDWIAAHRVVTRDARVRPQTERAQLYARRARPAAASRASARA